ncbi:MAG: hypothetical protein ACR2J5_02360, partial [Geodermatophilaceae bacterium]
IRVLADWTLALLFRREITSLGQIQDPRREFVDVAGSIAGSDASNVTASGSTAIPASQLASGA